MTVIRTVLGASTALVLGTLTAQAGGIDRSGQGLGALFEKGRYFELSFGSVQPTVSGNDVALFGGGATGDVAGDYTQFALSYKYDINDRLSFALNIDQPFGADVVYGASSVALGNTRAYAESLGITGLLRYKFSDNVSVHGGIRADQASAVIDLRGAAYGALGGYSVNLGNDWALGYVVGAAYEIPDIALRVAVTYNSAIEHDFQSVETGLPGPLAVFNGVTSTTSVETPQSVNIDFQSGIAKDTLLFGQIRWVDWSSFKLRPPAFIQAPGQTDGLIALEDTITYSLGVGRRFNETWAGSVSVSYEATGSSNLVSPLAPTDGRLGLTVGGTYTKDNMKVSFGVNYTQLGDAQPETGTPDTARASMTGSTAVGIGVKVGWSF